MSYFMLDGKYCGFKELLISDLWKHLPTFFTEFNLLITCLDSTRNLRTLTRWLARLEESSISPYFVGDAVAIRAKDVGTIFEAGTTFYGSDEIYLVREIPSQLPERLRSFTTDSVRFTTSLPVEFVKTFRSINASRYVSDGAGGLGLNYVCDEKSLVDKIETT